MDRLTRSVRDLGHLVEKYFQAGIYALLSVSEQIDTRSAAGRLILNVLASVSQWEREAIGERTAAAMQYKAERGEYTGGGAPYGYRNWKGRLVIDPDEQETVALVAKLRSRGLSFRAIAAELRVQGYQARNGKPFAPMQVSRMPFATC